jgi:hypothetical protein
LWPFPVHLSRELQSFQPQRGDCCVPVDLNLDVVPSRQVSQDWSNLFCRAQIKVKKEVLPIHRTVFAKMEQYRTLKVPPPFPFSFLLWA